MAVAVALLILPRSERFWSRYKVLPAIFIGTALLQFQLSQPRAFWLFRYEAYVMAIGILAVAVGLERLFRTSWSGRATVRRLAFGAALLVAVASPLRARAIRAIRILPTAVANIHEQQYQMGLFLHRYYEGQTVALNDIGAATYLAAIRCVDLVGLADVEIARMKMAGYYVTDDIAELVERRDVRIAIVYDYQLERRGGIPPRWIRAATWTIRHNVVTGSATVAFYAVDPAAYRGLVENLREFAGRLPTGVTVSM
jgi:hypothetical protein